MHGLQASLGKNLADGYLSGHQMNEAPGSINFTMFLTMLGEKLMNPDPEDVIRNAYFDEEVTSPERLP